MLRKKEQKSPVCSTTVAKLSDNGAELYEILRELRGELAKAAGVPAYVIFSNATLQDMVKKQPQTLTAFKQVSGVGELKASRYGKVFLQRIREYLASQLP